jgi:hypothetical protein
MDIDDKKGEHKWVSGDYSISILNIEKHSNYLGPI